MTQGWVIDPTADTITFFDPVLSSETVVVNEYASGQINATAVWSVGAWNDAYGYPGVAEFYSDRLGFAATTDQPQTLWYSRVGDYSMFGRSTPIADDDAFTATMNARQLNTISDLIPKQDLLVATAGGVWKVGDSSEPLTPTTAKAKPQPSVGGGALRGLDVGESYIYTTHKGSQVRDLTYTFEADGYAGSDLTAFASHLTKGYRLQSWAWCSEPWSCVFAVRNDGILLSMTYKREHQVVAWSRLTTQGKFLQVASIPEDDTYGTYACVERVVNGQMVRYVERFADPVAGDVREEVGVDCVLTYDGRNTTTITLTGGAAPGEEVVATASSAIFSASNVGDDIVIDYDGTPCRINILSMDSATVVRGIASRALTAADLAPGTSWALAVDTLSGLGHLEGMMVQVGGDGFDLGTYVVAGGAITLRSPAVLAHVGLPFDADFESLDMTVVGGQSVATRNKVIKTVGILLQNTSMISAGGNGFDKLSKYRPRDSAMSMSLPPERRTDWVPVNVDSSWQRNPRVCLRASGPYGARVLAVEPDVEFGT